MKNQTAAEKFDLVPPWCVVHKFRREFGVVSSDQTMMYMGYESGGGWERFGDGEGYIESAERARRIARLTSPLDSWEPAADCPLPVEGWEVRRCATGPGWFVAAIGDNSIFSVSGAVNKRFDTRRAAIEWAWREAPAPDDAKPTSMDDQTVVGSVWNRADFSTLTVEKIGDDGSVTYKAERAGRWAGRFNSSRQEWCEWIAHNYIAPNQTDDAGAKEGPDRDAFNALDDRIGAVETKVEDMADVLARICPEADSQTDGKGRTLVEINRELERVVAWMNDDAKSEFDAIDRNVNAHAKRLDYISGRILDIEKNHRDLYDRVQRLVSARVDRPATINTRSDDASTNELATAAASDEGWREMLVPVAIAGRYREGGCVFWRTPDNNSETLWTCDERAASPGWDTPSQSYKPIPLHVVPQTFIDFRNRMAPPPNLAEWYKPKAAAGGWPAPVPGCTVDSRQDVADAIPSTFRIPGTTLAGCVRNLAAAHEEALKVQEQLRQSIAKEAAEGDKWYAERCDLKKQLADANTAAVAAEGRAHTAMKRASKAEEELAELRGKVENLRAAFSG